LDMRGETVLSNFYFFHFHFHFEDKLYHSIHFDGKTIEIFTYNLFVKSEMKL
jgi:hypothetical protein